MNENPGLLHTMHDVARFHQIEGAFSKYKICIAAAHPNKIYENNNKTELKLGSITTASCFVGWQGKTIFTHEGLDFTTKKNLFRCRFWDINSKNFTKTKKHCGIPRQQKHPNEQWQRICRQRERMKPQTSTERIIAQATLRICSTMVFVSNCMLFLNEFVVYWHPTTREHSDAGYRTNSQSHTKNFSQSGKKNQTQLPNSGSHDKTGYYSTNYGWQE